MASLVSVKLSSTNFLLWKSQVYPLIRSAQLLYHLEEAAPVQTIIKDGNEMGNPEYDVWLSNDGLLTSWILGTMNEESLSLVVGYDSALQIWRCLEEHYLASSKESELHLKGQLATKRGDGESLNDFIRKFKRTCDNLAAICKPVANLDKVFQLSRVVGTRYQPYNLAVLSKAPYPTFNQYTSGLLNNERDLQQSCTTTKRVTKEISTKDCDITRFDHAYQSEELPQALAIITLEDDKDQTFYADTGASDHMTSGTSNLIFKRPYNGKQNVYTGDGTPLHITHIGSTSVGPLKLNNVLVVPNLKKNLISISKFTEENPCIFEFSSSGFVVKDQITQAILTKGTRKGQLYALDEGEKYALATLTNKAVDTIWHQRLGHPNSRILKNLSSKKNIVVSRWTTPPHLCTSCQMGKSCKLPFTRNNERAKFPFHKIHCDLWGPSPVQLTHHFLYYVIFVDDYSSTAFLNHLAECGIQQQVSCLGTPEQNGVAERKHRHIIKTDLTSEEEQSQLAIDRISAIPLVNEDESSQQSQDNGTIRTIENNNSPMLSPTEENQSELVPEDQGNEIQYQRTQEQSGNLEIIEVMVLNRSGVSPPSYNNVSISTHPMQTRAGTGAHTGHVKTIFPKNANTMVKAMQEEIDALHKNNTWTLVPPPSETNIVGSRWVFKTKLNPNHTVGRFKARPVARGFSQMPGVDFEETFSPILKPTTLRLVLAFATTLEWPLRQLDVKNAFLHGKLKEMVYMTQPPGFEDPKYPHYVCQLNCSIYGLKQAPKAWFDTFTLYLLKMGFHCNQADSSFFVLHNPKGTAFLLVYVDDIVLTTSSDDLL
ncbi:hypothetical protein SLEP1_g15775 [Rubroshorea leprosula]|uniref:Retrovirus-related Pol polyprotein from transposon RE1 n=1 Tax=Rubroshorea leprosula TaxID=152421 RepID=A0AAV5IXX4_9ROSI|nr:hypothetical protein SLEP1_g15775 [Rubroshorea leprosula]